MTPTKRSTETARKLIADAVMGFPLAERRVTLVNEARALEIRQFHIDLAQLQFSYGLKLSTDGTFGIEDARTTLPDGYEYSAVIRSDGRLEIADWVEEEGDMERGRR